MAPDQFGVARPLGPEDLDRHVTRHGVYPSFPAPTGVPWNEYVRSQMNRSRSVSSSTEVLDSDHARYITRRITQHARSMATGTRSLPTGSPVPYFQQPERGYVSEGVPSDIDLPVGALHETQNVQIPPRHANSYIFPYLPSRVLNMTLGLWIKINCLPTLALMIMIHCLRLDMVGEPWTVYLYQVRGYLLPPQ